MKKQLLVIFISIFMMILPAIAFADTIYLKDGSTIIGDIIEINDETITIKTDFGILKIFKDKIEKIEFEVKPQEEEKQDDIYSKIREEVRKALEKLQTEENTTIIVVVVFVESEKENNDIKTNTTPIIDDNTNATTNIDDKTNTTPIIDDNTNATTNINDEPDNKTNKENNQSKLGKSKIGFGLGLNMLFGGSPYVSNSLLNIEYSYLLSPIVYFDIKLNIPIIPIMGIMFGVDVGFTFFSETTNCAYKQSNTTNYINFNIGIGFVYLSHGWDLFGMDLFLGFERVAKFGKVEFVYGNKLAFLILPTWGIGLSFSLGIRFHI